MDILDIIVSIGCLLLYLGFGFDLFFGEKLEKFIKQEKIDNESRNSL